MFRKRFIVNYSQGSSLVNHILILYAFTHKGAERKAKKLLNNGKVRYIINSIGKGD